MTWHRGVLLLLEVIPACYPDLVGLMELWLEDEVLLVFIAWLMSSPRSIVRVPWLLTELDIPLI